MIGVGSRGSSDFDGVMLGWERMGVIEGHTYMPEHWHGSLLQECRLVSGGGSLNDIHRFISGGVRRRSG